MIAQHTIREIKVEEIPMLDNFLYEAIYIPHDYVGTVPHDIIYKDENVYSFIKDFGKFDDDYAFVAEVSGKIIGAVWSRTNEGYGNINSSTPHLAISLYKEYRSQGIGTSMMQHILQFLKEKGYAQVSLGVNKENYAVNMYKKVGFKIIGDGADDTEWLMVCNLSDEI